MESENNGRDATCPAEEDNHLEKQADAVSGEPPCIDSKPGAADGAGQQEHAKKPGNTMVLVERATALRGLAITRPRTPKGTLRKRSLEEIRSLDPEVPYVKFEAAARDLVCSLMERQDRMNEEIFNKIVDLEYRLKDLELEMIDLNEKRGRS
jgi:hypothetical protein